MAGLANLLPGKQVPPGQIGQSLREAFDEAAVQEKTPETVQASTVLSNIILCVPSYKTFDKKLLQEFIQDVCVLHPSRVFIIAVEDDDELKDKILSSVLSRCFIAENSTHTCSEEVYLLAHSESLDLVDNLLLSLLVPDIQTTLGIFHPSFQQEGPLKEDKLRDYIFNAFLTDVAGVQKLVFSTNDFSVAEEGISDIKSAIQRQKSLSTADYTWKRTERLREIVKEQFDYCMLQEAIPDLEQVHIVHNKACRSAYLFAGWIAGSFGVESEITIGEEAVIRADDVSFRISFEPVETNDIPIKELIMSFSSGMKLQITRPSDGMYELHVTNGQELVLHKQLTAHRRNARSVFIRELTSPPVKRDLYIRSLQAIEC